MLEWEVTHYWMAILNARNLREWVQFVITTGTSESPCRIIVREDRSGVPHKMISVWSGTKDEARRIWNSYRDNMHGVPQDQWTEVRSGQLGAPMTQYTTA